MKMRPPALPIITVDPYFSVWTEGSVLENTVHWTGKPNSISGRVTVDGTEYRFLGLKTPDKSDICDMTVEKTDIDAFSTVIAYTNSRIRLTVRFTSPLLPDSLYYASRPVSYCHASYESIDGKEHSVTVRLTFSEELVLNKRGEGRALAYAVNIPNLTAIKMGNGVQRALNKSGDDVRIDWGYLYLAVKDGRVSHTVLDGMYAVYAEADLKSDALFLIAYDDVKCLNYFGEELSAYWKKDGKSAEEAIAEAADEYEALLARCNSFSEKLKNAATEKGNAKYAELLLLATRQVMAAHKLAVDTRGDIIYVSKECFSGGFGATVDVTYPSSPMFLLYNPELLKGMLRPVMRYFTSDEWKFDFSPHDVGLYPVICGQCYGVDRSKSGEPVIDENMQMPVEECGNMLILFSALCDAENSASFAEQYADILKKWCGYLIKYGLDPENQLCTDDFAGHLAHNVNLSIKAIMGIAGYSRILARLGRSEEADKMMETARRYAASLVERARNSDGSCSLAYDRKETFSLKYNAVWDKIWKTKLFPDEFYEGEVTRYKKELLPYGVPLDTREKYTKSDWLVWAASLSDKKEDFNLLTESLWSAYNTMRTRAPLPDWYYADTSQLREFRHRSVQGGLFMRLMLD